MYFYLTCDYIDDIFSINHVNHVSQFYLPSESVGNTQFLYLFHISSITLHGGVITDKLFLPLSPDEERDSLSSLPSIMKKKMTLSSPKG